MDEKGGKKERKTESTSRTSSTEITLIAEVIDLCRRKFASHSLTQHPS
jgi:hypothetical protein